MRSGAASPPPAPDPAPPRGPAGRRPPAVEHPALGCPLQPDPVGGVVEPQPRAYVVGQREPLEQRTLGGLGRQVEHLQAGARVRDRARTAYLGGHRQPAGRPRDRDPVVSVHDEEQLAQLDEPHRQQHPALGQRVRDRLPAGAQPRVSRAERAVEVAAPRRRADHLGHRDVARLAGHPAARAQRVGGVRQGHGGGRRGRLAPRGADPASPSRPSQHLVEARHASDFLHRLGARSCRIHRRLSI